MGKQKKKVSASHADSLADEVLIAIFRYVGWEDVARSASLVSRRWYSVATDDALWTSFFHSQWPGGGLQESPSPRLQFQDRYSGKLMWWRKYHFMTQLPYVHPRDIPPPSIPASHDEHTIKIAVEGFPGVGKSALTIQFVQNVFLEDYDPTIEDSYRKLINVDDRSVLLDVLDTAQQEEYSSMRDRYVRSTQVLMLMYSATSLESFCACKPFLHHILRVKDTDWVPVVLVENKIDLVEQREVPEGLGEKAARWIGCLFVRTSAKTREGVDEAFHAAAKLFLAEGPCGDKKWAKQRRHHSKRKNCLLS